MHVSSRDGDDIEREVGEGEEKEELEEKRLRPLRRAYDHRRGPRRGSRAGVPVEEQQRVGVGVGPHEH